MAEGPCQVALPRAEIMRCLRINFQVGQARMNTPHVRYGKEDEGEEEVIFCRNLKCHTYLNSVTLKPC
jgi:hypothetical protein